MSNSDEKNRIAIVPIALIMFNLPVFTHSAYNQLVAKCILGSFSCMSTLFGIMLPIRHFCVNVLCIL